ncbi:hypothetical protein PGT21_019016 [Puccinia graminis f. sp. tritici]|uniref:Uncharacterized protein n=1 Tax=Puccinia graminis f. sp. tritici TaxID=56615 RepID=A0A5B0RJ91_PUCGR|nr:hypothetical protein PGT21_019016 [Puccinia graminis f. sp. tritici]KAA1125886.1 hypothetical protein PGTUg99_015218 [Puccinia graminis f. sp. tritici]
MPEWKEAKLIGVQELVLKSEFDPRTRYGSISFLFALRSALFSDGEQRFGFGEFESISFHIHGSPGRTTRVPQFAVGRTLFDPAQDDDEIAGRTCTDNQPSTHLGTQLACSALGLPDGSGPVAPTDLHHAPLPVWRTTCGKP